MSPGRRRVPAAAPEPLAGSTHGQIAVLAVRLRAEGHFSRENGPEMAVAVTDSQERANATLCILQRRQPWLSVLCIVRSYRLLASWHNESTRPTHTPVHGNRVTTQVDRGVHLFCPYPCPTQEAITPALMLAPYAQAHAEAVVAMNEEKGGRRPSRSVIQVQALWL